MHLAESKGGEEFDFGESEEAFHSSVAREHNVKD